MYIKQFMPSCIGHADNSDCNERKQLVMNCKLRSQITPVPGCMPMFHCVILPMCTILGTTAVLGMFVDVIL